MAKSISAVQFHMQLTLISLIRARVLLLLLSRERHSLDIDFVALREEGMVRFSKTLAYLAAK